MSEEEKEKYFITSDIRYIKSKNIPQIDISLNNFDVPKKTLYFKNYSYNNVQNKILFGQNNYSTKFNLNYINNYEKSECLKSHKLFENKKNNLYSLTPIELDNIFKKTMDHVLVTKPFYMALKNVNIDKLELDYFIKNLSKINVDIYELLDGCLDPISHLL